MSPIDITLYCTLQHIGERFVRRSVCRRVLVRGGRYRHDLALRRLFFLPALGHTAKVILRELAYTRSNRLHVLQRFKTHSNICHML